VSQPLSSSAGTGSQLNGLLNNISSPSPLSSPVPQRCEKELKSTNHIFKNKPVSKSPKTQINQPLNAKKHFPRCSTVAALLAYLASPRWYPSKDAKL